MGKMIEPEDLGTLVAEKDIPLATQLNLIKRRTERGMTPSQIARLMGLKVKDVKALVKTNGWTAKREVTEAPAQGRPPRPAEKTKARTEELKRLAKEGYSRKDIAALLGIDRGYVDTLCRRYGIRTASQRERVERLYASGWNQQAIADELGVSRQRISEMIKQYGYEKGAKP